MKKTLLAAGALATAIAGQPAQAKSPVVSRTASTSQQVEKIVQPTNTGSWGTDMNAPQVSFGGITQGREVGVAGALLLPNGSWAIQLSGDVTNNQQHALVAAGYQMENGYVIINASAAREKHYGSPLTGWGTGVDVQFTNLGEILKQAGVRVSYQKANNKDLGSTSRTETKDQQRWEYSPDYRTLYNYTDTTTNTYTRSRRFEGHAYGKAAVNAVAKVGKNGELVVELSQNFGHNHDTNVTGQYNHYFNQDRSRAYVSASTDHNRIATGIEHQVSRNTKVFAQGYTEKNSQTNRRNNGVMVGFRYTFGGSSSDAPKLRSQDAYINTQARFQQALRDTNTMNTGIRNLNDKGTLRISDTTSQTTSTKLVETLDSALTIAEKLDAQVDAEMDNVMRDWALNGFLSEWNEWPAEDRIHESIIYKWKLPENTDIQFKFSVYVPDHIKALEPKAKNLGLISPSEEDILKAIRVERDNGMIKVVLEPDRIYEGRNLDPSNIYYATSAGQAIEYEIIVSGIDKSGEIGTVTHYHRNGGIPVPIFFLRK